MLAMLAKHGFPASLPRVRLPPGYPGMGLCIFVSAGFFKFSVDGDRLTLMCVADGTSAVTLQTACESAVLVIDEQLHLTVI